LTALYSLIPDITAFTKKKMPQDILHGWSHIERVLFYAQRINREINAEWDVIHCSVLLHDVGHSIKRKGHNRISAEIAEEYLRTRGIDQKTIALIKECIITHSRQFSDRLPESPEAKVVFDADGMDLFGPIGLLRALLACWLEDKGFPCMVEKIRWRLKQKDNFYSNTARRFAHDNTALIETYLRELEEQLHMLDRVD
jgi:HD superfamily phosphodiesterase